MIPCEKDQESWERDGILLGREGFIGRKMAAFRWKFLPVHFFFLCRWRDVMRKPGRPGEGMA